MCQLLQRLRILVQHNEHNRTFPSQSNDEGCEPSRNRIQSLLKMSLETLEVRDIGDPGQQLFKSFWCRRRIESAFETQPQDLRQISQQSRRRPQDIGVSRC